MFRKLILAVCVAAIVAIGGAQAYGQDAAALAAALDKNKYKNKEKTKNGVVVASFEMYIDIKNEPFVKQPAEYSGTYAEEDGRFSLNLKVSADGRAEGSGVDTINGDPNANKMAYTLKNARVQGAVLTEDKIFADGSSERLEAVFVKRTTLTGKNKDSIETRDTAFGLGFVQTNGKWTNRVFLMPR